MQPHELPDTLAAGTAGPVSCEVQCARCRHVAAHDVHGAAIHPEPRQADPGGEWDGIVLSRILTCAACGAEDEYTILPEAKLALAVRALAEGLERKARGEDPGSGAFVLGVSGLWDGTVVRRPTEALAHLRELTDEWPDSGQAWRRLGNAYERYGLTDRAEAAWRKAVDVEPEEFEAAFSLAKVHYDADRVADGFPFLVRAIAKLPGAAELSPGMRAAFAEAIVGYLRGTVECTRQPLALEAAWRDGEVRGEPVVRLSSVDLRKITRWDRLTDFVTGEDILALRLGDKVPEDGDSQLLALLEAGPQRRGSRREVPATRVRSGPRVGRNDPCPCGSGKKSKRCCAQ